MRIGILADIHDEVDHLKAALSGFGDLAVDRIVSLGDAFDTFRSGEPGVEVARLLQDAESIGVWGNHDFKLSSETPAVLHKQADPSLLEFSQTLKPWLALENSRFSHLAAWLEADSKEAVWPMTVIPGASQPAGAFFDTIPENFLFVGHFHCWAAVTPAGPLSWNGEGKLALNRKDKHLIMVGAVADGWSAVFDTDTAVLTPVRNI